MELSTAEQVYEALERNQDEPDGRAKSARAEEIVAAADALGDPEVLVSALTELMEAYEYGAEHAKAPVAFARLLRLLDSTPESFSEYELHRTHWYFKWVTNFLLQVPDVPLASVHGWLDEMARRYALAGYSMRTVAGEREWLYQHIGDLASAEREREIIRGLPRDTMSDCAACEARGLGLLDLEASRDAAALEAWGPVLDGTMRCREEPAVTLAYSLLPLLRLGRHAEAAAHHQRGYAMARGRINLSATIGRHLEFAALTGNAGRGLEILAEHRTMLTEITDPLPRLGLLGGAAVLLRWLAATGYANVPIGPDTAGDLAVRLTAEAEDIAARFDARNGTSAVGDRLRARLAREPFAPAVARGVRPQPGARDMAGPDLAALTARARELSDAGHPDAGDAWRAVAAVAGDEVTDDLLAGELAGARASAAADTGDWATAAREATFAADRYRAAGEAGRALAATARAEWAAGQGAPSGPDRWARLDELLAAARDLLAAGQAAPGDLLTVQHARAVMAVAALHRGAPAERPALATRASAEADALIAGAREHQSPDREGSGEAILAAVARIEGRTEAEIAGLRRAVELTTAGGRPWDTLDYRGRLGELLLTAGRPDEAAIVLEEAIATAARWPKQRFHAGVAHMILATAYRAQGNAGLAVANARMGVARLDRDGDREILTRARADLGLALAQAGQLDEAVTTLEEAIGELTDPQAAARYRAVLAQCLSRAGDHRGAAGQFALSAAVLERGPDTDAFLSATADTALALAEAGLWPEAHHAYQRAVELTQAHERWPLLVRLHRELAQVAVRDGGDDGPGRAAQHIEQALAAGERAGFGEPAERGRTQLAAARAMSQAGRYEEALRWAGRAAADLTADDVIGDYALTAHLAATIEGTRLGRPAAAVRRLAAAMERCEALGQQDAVNALAQLAAQFGAADR
jgi:tetratricopeptide (TPR) repeat protein